MPKVTETVLEINLNNLERNYHFLRSKLEPATKFLGVVKAFAYGSDALVIAKKLEDLGADYLAVAYVDEGVHLRKNGVKLPILVLHPQVSNFTSLIKYNLEPSIYSRKVLKEFISICRNKRLQNYQIHIKFNSGLNRLGFRENDIDFIAEQLNDNRLLKVTSIFSHLAASEDLEEKKFTLNQVATFTKIISSFDQRIDHKPFKHLLNTSGIINFPEAQFDMVRSGIGLYGYGNDKKIDVKLKPVATLKTIISQIHKIEAGETVGYNRAYSSNDNKVTATLPIGHADGIGRQYGNGKTYVYINDQPALIIGNVCMDMIMIDISHIDCKEGDEVLIFGETNNASTFANSSKTISYEVLTGISQRVKRRCIYK